MIRKNLFDVLVGHKNHFYDVHHLTQQEDKFDEIDVSFFLSFSHFPLLSL